MLIIHHLCIRFAQPNANECFPSLTEAFGGFAPLRTTVGNWFREFRVERQSPEDEPRAGRPNTAVTDKFKGGKAKDVYNIVTGDKTWLYYYELETKRQSKIWCSPPNEPPTKVRKSCSGRRKMTASLSSITVHLTTVSFDGEKTVTAEWYTTYCLPKVIR